MSRKTRETPYQAKIRECREYCKAEDISNVLAKILALCHRERPVNPFKFIADELYKREEIALPDEESSERQKIIELEADVAYYKNLALSLNRAKGNPIGPSEIKKEVILTPHSSTNSIHLDNGVTVKIPNLNILANGTQSSVSDGSRSNQETRRNSPLLSEDSDSSEEEEEDPKKKRSDSESSGSSNQNSRNNRSSTEQRKNGKVSNGQLSGSDTEVDEPDSSDSLMDEDSDPEIQPKQNQNPPTEPKMPDSKPATSPRNTQQRIDDDIENFFKTLDTSDRRSESLEPLAPVETLEDVISALTENPAKISPIADREEVMDEQVESDGDESPEPQEKKMKLDLLDNSEGSGGPEKLGIFEYPVVSVDTKILGLSGLSFQYPEFPSTSKKAGNPDNVEIMVCETRTKHTGLDQEHPVEPEIKNKAKTSQKNKTEEQQETTETENRDTDQSTPENLDEATDTEKPDDKEEPETAKTPEKKTIVERDFFQMDDDLELDYEYDDL